MVPSGSQWKGLYWSGKKTGDRPGALSVQEYFSTTGIPLLLGREIGPHDGAASPQVCVINEAFAKHFFAGRNPIGKHITVNSVPLEIVGIAKDVRVNSLRGPIEPKFYAAADQKSGAFSFEIRTVAIRIEF